MAKYIPEQHYITWRNFADDLPLAFMTVYGTDAAAKQRMATADQWVNRHRGGILPVKNIWDNEPLKGFEVAKEVRRWSTSNVLWRVNDPRGFQLEISSGNMAYLLSNCTVKEGKFEDELLWVRDGPNNYLLPTASDEFALYERNSVAKKSNTKISEVNVGDRISLPSGETGIYLGMYSCVNIGAKWKNSSIINNKRYHILRNEEDKNNIRYVAKSSWKNILIDERNAAEAKDYSDEINMNTGKFFSPNDADYVQKDPVKVTEVLKTLSKTPVDDKRDEYFVEFQGQIFEVYLYKGKHMRDDGQMIPFDLNSKNNEVVSDWNQQIDITDKPTSGFGNRRKCVTLDQIKDLEKFVYTVVIDDKTHAISFQ